MRKRYITRPAMALAAIASSLTLSLALSIPQVSAAPLTPARVAAICATADGPAHCGRLIEAEQLKDLPGLAKRDGDTLRVTLFPSGKRDFVDTESVRGINATALWDYWSPVNAVVLFTNQLDRIGYAILQRATNTLTALPAEPVLAPDRARLAVADFCLDGCENELSVWRVARDGIRRELTWRPTTPWTEATVTWKDAEVIVVSYVATGTDKPATMERRIDAPDWVRVGAR